MTLVGLLSPDYPLPLEGLRYCHPLDMCSPQLALTDDWPFHSCAGYLIYIIGEAVVLNTT